MKKDTISDTTEQIAAKIQAMLKEDDAKIRMGLIGRSGVGKSTLINKIIGTNKCPVSHGKDGTVNIDEYHANDNYYFVDMPGYGTQMFPSENWGDKFDIKQYDLFLCTFTGRLFEDDIKFFKYLLDLKVPVIFVRTKYDELKNAVRIETGEFYNDSDLCNAESSILDNLKAQLEVKNINLVFTDCLHLEGLPELTRLIADNLNSAKRMKFIRESVAYTKDFLDLKYSAIEKRIVLYSALSGLGAAVPVPGLGMAIDVGVFLKLLDEIKRDYGLTEEYIARIATIEQYAPIVAKIASSAIGAGLSKEAVIRFLSKVLSKNAEKIIAKEFAKYIPVIGSLVAGSASFALTKLAGDEFNKICKEVADDLFEINFNSRGVK